MLEDVKSVLSLGIGSVVKTVAFYAIASIYEEKVTAVVVGFLAQMMGKGYVIAPVSGILRPVSPCQIKVRAESHNRLTLAGGRHASHVYQLSPRSSIDPKEAFAREPLQVQGLMAEQLEQPAVGL